MSQFDLDDFLPYRLNLLSERISKEFATRYQAAYGISIAEWRVVAHLAQGGEVSVRDIHARVHMDKSRVSRAAARLEVAGYVRKHQNTDDRRLVTLTLTERGAQMMRELGEMAQKFDEELRARLSQDQDGLASGVTRLLGESDHT